MSDRTPATAGASRKHGSMQRIRAAMLETLRPRVKWDNLLAALATASVGAVLGIVAGIDPTFAIGGALGLCVLMLAVADLSIGLAGLVLIAFLERITVASDAVTFTKVIGLVLTCSWLAHLATNRSGRSAALPSAHPVGTYVLVLFLTWAALSGIWASGEGFVTDLQRYLLNAVLFVIVYTAVRTRRQAGWVIAAFIAGATIAAAYGIVVRPVVDPAAIDRLTVGDPNELAAALIAGVALSLGAAFGLRKSPGLRLAAAACALVMLVGFLLTGSRGGLVGLGAALVAAIVVAGRWRWHATTLAVVVAGLATMYIAVYAPDEIRDRIVAATSGESRSGEGRDTIWAVAFRMVEDRPLVGVGLASFGDEAVAYAIEPGRTFRTDEVIDSPSVAHNTYLQVWAELGLVGLVLFLGVIIFALSTALRAARRFSGQGDLEMELVARALVVGTVGVLAANFFISEQFSNTFWLLLGLGPALLGVARLRDQNGGAAAAAAHVRADRLRSST